MHSCTSSSHVGLFRSWLCTLGTHYHPMLDPAILWTPSNDTSRPICSDSLNLIPPALMYLRTLSRYTNAVIISYLITTPVVSPPSIRRERVTSFHQVTPLYRRCEFWEPRTDAGVSADIARHPRANYCDGTPGHHRHGTARHTNDDDIRNQYVYVRHTRDALCTGIRKIPRY